MMKTLLLLAVLGLALASPPTIVENAVATPALSTLVSVVTMPEYKPILDALSGDGPFTVFAPTNDAFAAAGVDVTDVETVSAVLQYHVVAGAAVYSGDLKKSQKVKSLQGEKIEVLKKPKGVFVNGAKVVVADVASSNGVVHVIDAVILPPSFTAVVAEPEPEPVPSIVENAVATPALSTLVSVLTMPEYKPVLDALSGDGPFTVFAPTNDAFAAAGVDVTDVEAVTSVLKYHVIAGAAVYSGDLAAAQDVATFNGATVEVLKNPAGVTVNGAKVVVADVASSNGVVHVIDAVLLPPAAGAAPAATDAPRRVIPGNTLASRYGINGIGYGIQAPTFSRYTGVGFNNGFNNGFNWGYGGFNGGFNRGFNRGFGGYRGGFGGYRGGFGGYGGYGRRGGFWG